MGLNSIIKLYKQGNVSVSGNCGSGKDLLQANVIVRRKKPYVSNINYGGEWYPLDFDKLDCGSSYEDFINGTTKEYTYPYPLGADVYISDCGIYLPSQYCNELNKKYSRLPTFFAIRRHVGRCNVHTNSQHLGRVWDKLREQSDTYIVCRSAKVIFGIVFQTITIYDRFASAEMRIKPCRVSSPLLGLKDARLQADIARDNFANTHGTVKNRLLIYRNKSNYDTHHFYKLLKGDEKKLEDYQKSNTSSFRLRFSFKRSRSSN
jgi:hypothetical protein